MGDPSGSLSLSLIIKAKLTIRHSIARMEGGANSLSLQCHLESMTDRWVIVGNGCGSLLFRLAASPVQTGFTMNDTTLRPCQESLLELLPQQSSKMLRRSVVHGRAEPSTNTNVAMITSRRVSA